MTSPRAELEHEYSRFPQAATGFQNSNNTKARFLVMIHAPCYSALVSAPGRVPSRIQAHQWPLSGTGQLGAERKGHEKSPGMSLNGSVQN